MTSPRLVLFSHVDGVLSEPASTPVVNAVSLLARARVPLVLCSSRTRAEIEHIALALGTRHPFVCEHGNALFVPRGYFPFPVGNSREIAGYDVVEFGRRYPSVVDTLHRTAERVSVPVRGFSDMSVEEVADEYGLSMLVARLAKLRDYGELFRVLDGSRGGLEHLTAALDAAGLPCIRGPRYHHVGAAVDTTLGISMLCEMYQRACGPVSTVSITSQGSHAPFARVVSSTAAVDAETPAAWARCVGDLVAGHGRQNPEVAGSYGRTSWLF